MTAVEAIWHDLECGRYDADLALWLELAEATDGPILDVGAGTGRVTLALARAGHHVTALDFDPELLAVLARRAEGLPVRTVLADARDFDLSPKRFPLVIAPMQTVQLLGGHEQHVRFFSCARRPLAPGGRIAVTLAPTTAFEPFDVTAGDVAPLPDLAELDGQAYVSQPLAVRREGDHFTLLRRRETVAGDGRLSREENRIELDIADCDGLRAAGAEAGLRLIEVRRIEPTLEHIGSEVVIFGE